MRLCKKVLGTALLALTMLVLISGTVLAAYSYYATVQVQETGSNSYNYLPVIADIDNDYLSDNGYISLTGLDTRLLSGSSELKHLVADDKLLFVIPSVGADSTGNYRYTLNNTSDLSSFPIITGYNGFLTIPSDIGDDMQLGDDFEIEQEGYVDTAYNMGEYLAYKRGAFATYVSAATDITSDILNAEALQENNVAGRIAGENVWGDNWVAQTFTPAATHHLATVELHGIKVLNPAGNGIIGLRATDGGLPTGNDIATTTFVAGSWAAGPAWQGQVVFDMPVRLDAATVYALVFRVPNGDAANNLDWSVNNTNPYAGGQICKSADGGDTWIPTAGTDCLFREYGSTINKTVTASGFTSHEYIVTTLADTANLEIWIDGGLEGQQALAGASVLNNANDWMIAESSALPYMNYYKHTVADTLIAWYQPISMIVGTNLDDREGTDAGETGTKEEDATITWGANPAGLTITVGSLVSSSQPEVTPASEEETPDIVPEGSVPIQGGVVNTDNLQDNPLYPIVKVAHDYTDFSEEQIWFFGATFIVLIGMGLAAVRVSNHLLIAGTVGLVLGGFFTAMEIYQWWMMLIFGFMFLASIIMERKPVL